MYKTVYNCLRKWNILVEGITGEELQAITIFPPLFRYTNFTAVLEAAWVRRRRSGPRVLGKTLMSSRQLRMQLLGQHKVLWHSKNLSTRPHQTMATPIKCKRLWGLQEIHSLGLQKKPLISCSLVVQLSLQLFSFPLVWCIIDSGVCVYGVPESIHPWLTGANVCDFSLYTYSPTAWCLNLLLEIVTLKKKKSIQGENRLYR